MVPLESNSSLRASSRQKLNFCYKFQNHPCVVPVDTNNSSGPKKLLSTDSRKARPTILTVPIVRKLMTMHWDRSPFACLHCINRARGMMDATCYKHLPCYINMIWIKRNSLVCAFAFTFSQNQNFQKRKASSFFVWVTVSVTLLCVIIGLQWLPKDDGPGSSFPLLTMAW